VAELKIDKSFVMAMVTQDSDAKIVRSTIDLAHNLGLSVVAEGVENGDILSALNSLGCDEAQGYHVSRPVPATDFMAVCTRWESSLPTAAVSG
jgi:EAL domain-containing protein (putative c-di-GMP-specific phosphodiesterase class I)